MLSTVQEALITEMLGDIGLLHERIEALPEALQRATAPSLEAIAQSVKEAQVTINGYTEVQKLTIQQFTAEAMQSEAGSILADAARSLEASAQAHTAGAQAGKRQNALLVLVAILIALVTSGVSLAGGYLLFGREQAAQAGIGYATLSVWHDLPSKAKHLIQKAMSLEK